MNTSIPGIKNTVELTDIIYFQEIKRLGLLPYTTNVSIKKFCQKNGIEVFGTANKYVFAVQFQRGIFQSRVTELTAVYGEYWAKILNADLVIYKKYKDALTSIAPENTKAVSTERADYSPDNRIENKFLLDLESLLKLASPSHE